MMEVTTQWPVVGIFWPGWKRRPMNLCCSMTLETRETRRLPLRVLAACPLCDELYANLALCEWCCTFIYHGCVTIMTDRLPANDSNECSDQVFEGERARTKDEGDSAPLQFSSPATSTRTFPYTVTSKAERCWPVRRRAPLDR